MIQSIAFSDKDTYTDWGLIPTKDLIFAPPEVKTTTIDIPGGNGVLDLSESLSGYPLYENRTGSFDFYAINDGRTTNERYSDVMNYLHGRRLRAILSDSTEWYYIGRYTVESWEPGESWDEVTINYDVEPYKWNIKTSLDDDRFKNIEINKPNSQVSYSFPNSDFGTAPIVPTFTVKNPESFYIEFSNDNLDIYKKVLLNDSTYGSLTDQDMVIYADRGDPNDNAISFSFGGKGTVSISFRIGRL